MAHLRKRLIHAQFKKKLKSWPVLNLLGPRQCGKSTFLRELAFGEGSFTYETLDLLESRRKAKESPSIFLKGIETYPLMIDEVQKAPDLFDEIKAQVDKMRTPGRYILSGSVQFSRKTGIRESLTGRSATLRMDTMTLRETQGTKPISLTEVLRYFESGGMPAVCFLRDKAVQQEYWNEWLDTLCERDLKIFSSGRLSGDLARSILEESAQLEFPMVSEISKKLRVDARRIQNHLQALKDLFVIHEVPPHSQGVGKPIFFPFDCGLAKYLGAQPRRLWQVAFLVEFLNGERFQGKSVRMPHYYLTSRGSFIDYVIGNEFQLYCIDPVPPRREKMTLRAAMNKFSDAFFKVHCPVEKSYLLEKKQSVVSWVEFFDSMQSMIVSNK